MTAVTQSKVQNVNKSGMNVVRFDRCGITQHFLTSVPASNMELTCLFQQMADYILEHDAQIIKMDILGSNKMYPECIHISRKKFAAINWPITYIEGNSCFNHKIAGVQIYAVSGVAVETISQKNNPIARIYEDNYAKYCFLGNIQPDDVSASRRRQTKQTLKNLETGLNLAGMEMTDIVRTWFFNHKILDWYKEFNSVRSEFYREKHIFNRFLPASTGIGANNPFQSALISGALAMKTAQKKVTVKEILSPLQCPAYDYQSSFSRAVEITTPEYRHLFISGTASINSNGETAHINNTEAQIDLTFRVVEAILKSRSMSYSNVVRTIVYFKHKKSASALKQYYDKYGLSPAQLIIGHNDICRENLLFEIELDAILETR